MGGREFVWAVSNHSSPSLYAPRTSDPVLIPSDDAEQFAMTEVAYVAVRLLQRFDQMENRGDSGVVAKHSLSLNSSPFPGVNVILHEALNFCPD